MVGSSMPDPPPCEQYTDDYPLLHSMLRHESQRTAGLKHEGKSQMEYARGDAGWWRTLWVVRGRALDTIVVPWVLSVLHAVVYTVVQEQVYHVEPRDMENWEVFFALVLNTTLSFLLVFRLNRAAGRYWTARALWGMIIAKARCFLGIIITHGSHDIVNRDDAIRWVLASNVAAMELLRGVKPIPSQNLAGILTKEETTRLSDNAHPPIFAYDQARYHVHQLFPIDAATPCGLAHYWSRHVNSLEAQIDTMLECCGGLERIRGTPLPMVYVAHLRTFLLLALLGMPYVWGPAWRWSTIPIVAAASFAWLGIEGAAIEAQSPFGQDRVNALDMDGYCLSFLELVKQQLRHDANRDCRQQRNENSCDSSHVLSEAELACLMHNNG